MAYILGREVLDRNYLEALANPSFIYRTWRISRQQSRELEPSGLGSTTGKRFYILGIQDLPGMHKTVGFPRGTGGPLDNRGTGGPPFRSVRSLS